MLLDGNPADEAKARAWLKKQKYKARNEFIVADGKLIHGYKTNDEELNAHFASNAKRRDNNSGASYAELAPMAGFSHFAIRHYAARIGVSPARMYREPELLKKMIKDPEYSKFRLDDRAAKM